MPLTVAGCLLLAWLGVAGLRDALARKEPDPQRPDLQGPDPLAEPYGIRDRKAMAVGAGMSLANPWNVDYWSGAVGGVSTVLGQADAAELSGPRPAR